MDKSPEYERRVRSLKKRLTLDFQPLRDTLSRGLDVLIDPEAAVLCTATVEAMCDALFNVVIKNLHDEAASSLAPLDTKVTIYHLQVALRSHPDFSQLLQGVESAAVVLEYFLDDNASKSLYERNLIATREAKHLRASSSSSSVLPSASDQSPAMSDEQLIALHERTRSEWQKREDDPFTDVDFAMVLKCVHPAFTLAYSATMLLSALVRELLNEVCDLANVEKVQQRVPPELYVEDLAGPLARVFHVGDELGRHVDKTAGECLERFRLRSRQGATLTLRFRVYAQTGKANSATYALANVARDAKFTVLHVQMCRKCHLEPANTVGVYRGHQLEASVSPGLLSMPTGAVVYLVSKKWWDHTRRNEARRGLLSSLRPQDAQLKSLVESTTSKVKKEFSGGGSGPPTEWTSSSPFGFLAAASSPAMLLSVQPSKRMRRGMKSVHAASASRLMGFEASSGSTNKSSPSRRYSSDEEEEEEEAVGGEEEEEESKQYYQIHDEDSLSTLLKQRQQPPNNSKKSTVASLQRTSVDADGRRKIMSTLATQSTHLMDTLDEAWLGFAGISAGVRAMKEKIQRYEEEPPGGSEGMVDMEELEEELLTRLEKTRDLVRQTAEAHELVAQLLEGTRRLRGGLQAAAARRGGMR